MPDIMKYEIDFKKLKIKFNDSLISLDDYLHGLKQLIHILKKQALYPLQTRTNMAVLIHSNHSLALYKTIQNELMRYKIK